MRDQPAPSPVRLGEWDRQGHEPCLTDLVRQAQRAAAAGDRVGAAAELAVGPAERLPHPGAGRTTALWSALASLGSVDLTVARVVEPHLDARAILDQAGVPGWTPAGLLGVYAAEGAGHRLQAHRPESGQHRDDERGWLLDGSKPWCSLAGRVDAFLVTAWVDDERRGLFAVDRREVRGPGGRGSLSVAEEGWVARGLSEVVSPVTRFHMVPAQPVGRPGWYLSRPGFAWGGMGVAAVWFGAAVAIARRLTEHTRGRTPDQVAHLHVGRVEAALHRARCVLVAAGADVDAGRARGPSGARLALVVRAVVRSAVEEVLAEANHAMGPGPLVTEEEHARRVADLQVYLRQEHAERDAAALGRAVVDDLGGEWPVGAHRGLHHVVTHEGSQQGTADGVLRHVVTHEGSQQGTADGVLRHVVTHEGSQQGTADGVLHPVVTHEGEDEGVSGGAGGEGDACPHGDAGDEGAGAAGSGAGAGTDMERGGRW